MPDCGDAYDSHDWQWQGTRLVCTRCDLDDLAGRRLVEHVVDGLEQAGYRVERR